MPFRGLPFVGWSPTSGKRMSGTSRCTPRLLSECDFAWEMKEKSAKTLCPRLFWPESPRHHFTRRRRPTYFGCFQTATWKQNCMSRKLSGTTLPPVGHEPFLRTSAVRFFPWYATAAAPHCFSSEANTYSLPLKDFAIHHRQQEPQIASSRM